MKDKRDLDKEVVSENELPGEEYLGGVKHPRWAIYYERFNLRISGPVQISKGRRFLFFCEAGGDDQKEDFWKSHPEIEEGEAFVAYVNKSDKDSVIAMMPYARLGNPMQRFGVESFPIFIPDPFTSEGEVIGEEKPTREIVLHKPKSSKPRLGNPKTVVPENKTSLVSLDESVLPQTLEKASVDFVQTHLLEVKDVATFSLCWLREPREISLGKHPAMITISPKGAQVCVVKIGGEYFYKDMSSIGQFAETFVLSETPSI